MRAEDDPGAVTSGSPHHAQQVAGAVLDEVEPARGRLPGEPLAQVGVLAGPGVAPVAPGAGMPPDPREIGPHPVEAGRGDDTGVVLKATFRTPGVLKVAFTDTTARRTRAARVRARAQPSPRPPASRIGTRTPPASAAARPPGSPRPRAAARPSPGRWPAPAPASRAASAVPSATRDLARVDRAPDPDPAAVVDRHPRRPRRRVHQRVEQRPVGDRVRAVGHRLGLPVRRGDRPRVQVVAPDHDRRGHLPRRHQLVEPQPRDVALARAPASRSAPAAPGTRPSPAPRGSSAAACRRRGTARARPRRSPRCRPGRPTAPPTGTAPSPSRTAAGCRPARTRGRRTPGRSRPGGPRRGSSCRSRRPRRRRPGTRPSPRRAGPSTPAPGR